MTEANIRNRHVPKEEPLYDWLNDDKFWQKEVYPSDLPLAHYNDGERLFYIDQKSYSMKVPPVVLNSVIRAVHNPEETLEFFEENYHFSFRNTLGRCDEAKLFDFVREQNRIDEGKQDRRIPRRNFVSEFVECLNMCFNLRWRDSGRDFVQGSLLIMTSHRGKLKVYVEEGYKRGTNQKRCVAINPFGQPTKVVTEE